MTVSAIPNGWQVDGSASIDRFKGLVLEPEDVASLSQEAINNGDMRRDLGRVRIRIEVVDAMDS